MARLAVVLSLFFVSGADGFCADPPDGGNKNTQNMVLGIWRLPPGFISSADPSEKNGYRKPLLGVQSKQIPSATQFDASGFFESLGVPFPAGSAATYDQRLGILVVHNTQENLDSVASAFTVCFDPPPNNIVFEISTYECQLPAKNGSLSSAWPTYFDLQKLPDSDIRLLDRVSALAKTGRPTTMKHLIDPITAPATPSTDVGDAKVLSDPFQDGASGTIVDFETIIGSDYITIDSKVTYRFRPSTKDKMPSEVRFKTSFNSWDGYPHVLHVSPVINEKGKFYVVVGNTTLVTSGGWNLKDAWGIPDQPPAADSSP